jgi:GT2 family glycosyltransferase/glycosyltransferase involved in cell wall biosynthesis
MSGSQPAIKVSVIIPTYNRREILLRALAALNGQTCPDARFEVLICDDGSTDDTAAKAAQLATPYPLIYLHQPNRGPAAARNLGLRRARGEIILILNDDTLAAPDLVARHVQAHERLRQKKIKAAVLGIFTFKREEPPSPFLELLHQSDVHFRFSKMQPRQFYDYRHFWTCNLSLPRAAFEAAGLFDEDFREAAAEDIDLGYRLERQGYRIYYDPACRAEHDHPFSFTGFCRHRLAAGRNLILLAKKHPEITAAVTDLPGLADGERRVLGWLRANEPQALKALALLRQMQEQREAQAALVRNHRQEILDLFYLVDNYWMNQGFLEGLARYVFRLPAPGASCRLTFLALETEPPLGLAALAEYSRRLAARGYRVTLAAPREFGEKLPLDPGVAFLPVPPEGEIPPRQLPEGELIVAADARAAHLVARLPWRHGLKFFLVQDYPPPPADLAGFDSAYLLPLRKVTVSRRLQGLLQQRLGQKSQMIPSGVDPGVFFPDPAIRVQYPEADFRIGLVWPAAGQRDRTAAFMALRLVKLRFPQAKLVIVGKQQAGRKISGDEFVVCADQTQLRRYLCSLDAFIAGNWWAGQGTLAPEAMACGTPVVSVESGVDVDHTLPPDTILSCPRGTPGPLADALIRLMSEPELRPRLSQQGLAQAQKCSWENPVRELDNLFQTAVSEKLPAPQDPEECAIAKASTPEEESKIAVSIIIPVFNNLEFTRGCLASIYRDTAPEVTYEIIVVDNGSTDGTGAFLQQEETRGRVRVLANPENLGFARACNRGARAALGKYLVFLNNDTKVQPGWLAALVDPARKEEKTAVVGAKLLYADDTVQHAGVVFDADRKVYHLYREFPQSHPAVNKEREFQAITAACALFKKKVFFEAGAFDERYLNGIEDLDLCFRIREKGYKVVYNPQSVVYHYESRTPGRFAKEKENANLFLAIWYYEIIPDRDRFFQEDGVQIPGRELRTTRYLCEH